MAEPIPDNLDDDVFAYEGSGGLSQCISGFGRNAIDALDEEIFKHMSREHRDRVLDPAEQSIGELVRWCRHFNGELKKAKAAYQGLDPAAVGKLVEAARAVLDVCDPDLMPEFDQHTALKALQVALAGAGGGK